jgi:putative sterol carrier protein
LNNSRLAIRKQLSEQGTYHLLLFRLLTDFACDKKTGGTMGWSRDEEDRDMAFIFPSPEWCSECMKKLNESEAVAATGKNWGVGFNGNWVFEAQPGAGLEQPIFLYMEMGGGKCSDCRIIGEPSEVDAGYYCYGSYGDFKAVVKGERDFIGAAMKGDFKVKGDMSRVVKNAKYVAALARVLSTVDSEFLGE